MGTGILELWIAPLGLTDALTATNTSLDLHYIMCNHKSDRPIGAAMGATGPAS